MEENNKILNKLKDDLVCSPQIYREKKVLVTGHTGFKGAWLTLWLNALGADVIGFSLEPSNDPNLFELTKLEQKITHIIGDVRNQQELDAVIQEYQPDIIFHLAAQALVRFSFKHPRMTYETNIMGVVNLFEAIRKTDSVKAVINVTSDKCYENKNYFWGYREKDSMGGHDPYSSSKGCSELVTASYRRSFFNLEHDSSHKVAIASVRAGNVIGGGDWAQDRIIPDCIRALTENRSIIIRNPKAVRPWQFILEPLSGYLWLGGLLLELTLLKYKFASAWNFGPNIGQPLLNVKEVVEFIIQNWGEGTWTALKDTAKEPHEANYLKLDCTKVNHFLKWQALMEVEQTLQKTIYWYRSYYQNNEDAYNLCLNQIKDYIALADKKKMNWVPVLKI